jgi:toxin ParE1/3/4
MKRVVLRPRAEIDVVEVTQWYADQGGQALAERFFDAAREAANAIQGMPGIGSPRLGHITGIEGLRSWPLRRFPVRWFYIERDDFIDVVRLLGERQDIEAILGDEPAAPVG